MLPNLFKSDLSGTPATTTPASPVIFGTRPGARMPGLRATIADVRREGHHVAIIVDDVCHVSVVLLDDDQRLNLIAALAALRPEPEPALDPDTAASVMTAQMVAQLRDGTDEQRRAIRAQIGPMTGTGIPVSLGRAVVEDMIAIVEAAIAEAGQVVDSDFVRAGYDRAAHAAFGKRALRAWQDERDERDERAREAA